MKKRTIALLPLVAVALLSLSACGGGKSSSNNAANANASAPAEAPVTRTGAVPNCGATQAVWVNLNTKVYHEPGDPAYGKTKHGEYLCPSQAVAQGFHAAGGAKHHRHRRGAESST